MRVHFVTMDRVRILRMQGRPQRRAHKVQCKRQRCCGGRPGALHCSTGSVRTASLLGITRATFELPAFSDAPQGLTDTGGGDHAMVVHDEHGLNNTNHWYHQYSARDKAVARYKLGRMYCCEAEAHQQDGVQRSAEKDTRRKNELHKEARRLFEMSAAQGFAPAAFQLGRMAVRGVGGFRPFSFGIARMWWRRAATTHKGGTKTSVKNRVAAGHADAAFQLGILHYNGEGGPQDFEAAKFWFLRADELVKREHAVAVETQKFETGDDKLVIGPRHHERACFALSILHGSGKLNAAVATGQALSRRWRARARQSLGDRLHPALPKSALGG